MSAPQPTQPATGPRVVAPEGDSRLEQLAAQYDELKAAADEAAKAFDAVKDGIKAELSQLAPGESDVVLTSALLDAPLRMSQRVSWGLNTKALKAEQPELYVKYATQRTSWRLEVAS